MRKRSFELHVTLYNDSKTAVWFVVADNGTGVFDLQSDGDSPASRLPLVLADALSEWLLEQTGDS